MKKINQVLLVLFLTSASVLNFEIIATRISSVIFVNSYAFAILSLAVMGLSLGGVYEYYFGRSGNEGESPAANEVYKPVIYHVLSCILFVFFVTQIEAATSPFLFFSFIVFPFFFAGRFYSKAFKSFSSDSYKIYSADLAGAAIGSLLPLLLIPLVGPVNGVLVVSIILSAALTGLWLYSEKWLKAGSIFVVGILLSTLIALFVPKDWLGKIPIGYFEEKDIYHVYDDPGIKSSIIKSKWSVFGRSDLVEHSNQDLVKHIFVDGAAGTQMYQFDGDIQKIDPYLSTLLLQFTTSVPFLMLDEDQKNSMLVIGPGGGKEILTGLIADVASITGVEINKDFVEIVKEESDFNGGIYTDFPQVNIQVAEGRHYVKETSRTFDLVVMALPSTQQLQSIESYALSENYLLTVESIQDYLDVLTPEGELILTVHNTWELSKLIITTLKAFEEIGISRKEALNHFQILEADYSPTIVIKKQVFKEENIGNLISFLQQLPPELPKFTYIPYTWQELPNTLVNRLLHNIRDDSKSLSEIIDVQAYNIKAVKDDNPYFYNLNKGIPESFKSLLTFVFIFISIIIIVPFFYAKRAKPDLKTGTLVQYVFFFMALGSGFMLIELSLFQKLILYLGSPTISLSILLCSILVGMGLGSMGVSKLKFESPFKLLLVISSLIIVIGSLAIIVYPLILEGLIGDSLIKRGVISFLLILPLGLLLGIPFPTCIGLLEKEGLKQYIPWMYSINGALSITGSILAVVVSMMWGFITAFFLGIAFYLLIALILILNRNKTLA